MKRMVGFWGLTFVLFTTFVFGAELERHSGQSEDDGQESTSGGYVNTSFTFVELRPDLGRWGGAYRFPDIEIPQGATINSAYLSLACYVEIFRFPVNSIACEDVDSATVILSGTGTYDISSRWNNRTDATVLWQDTVNWGPAARDSTPDLSALVQEIVDRPNWKSGNAIIFLFKCTKVGSDSSNYETYSWDANPDSNYYGGILFVDYTPGGAVPNDTPVVSDIPNQSIPEGDSFGSINLDDYVTDSEDHDSVMIWTYWGEAELLVDVTDRVVTVTVPDSEWNDSETIWFKACDPGGLCDSNEAAFTVTAVNDPPIVSDIPDSSIAEDGSFNSVNLDEYVTDPDDHDSVMIWTYWGEMGLLVDVADRIATVTVPDSEWNGSETIWFKACDPGGLCDSNEATFTVTGLNDPPIVSDIPDSSIAEGGSFDPINLDDYVSDPDDHDSVMIWSHWGEAELLVDITDRVVTVTVPDSEWNGSDTIWFKACDPGELCDSNEATFTVTAVNDPPIVSDIPDSSIAEGGSFDPINLDDYVSDPDDHDSVMIWSHWGEVELLVDVTDRVVTVTVPDSEWNGSETIWFKACDPGGLCDSNEATFTVVGSESADEDSLLLGSADFFLNQNYPNPFNLKTNITYSLATGGKIKLTIYDLLGKRVKTLVDQYQSSGCKSFDWDGTNDKGNGVASGIYFYRLEAEQFTETKKLVLLK